MHNVGHFFQPCDNTTRFERGIHTSGHRELYGGDLSIRHDSIDDEAYIPTEDRICIYGKFKDKSMGNN